ncbi:hypothetical protein BD779DRAFT_17445 [Infundibulicybe gibba]|nr:hypothetical protein BD779DRAFT_17445 [Infundibulicybe gibba]
MAVHAEIFLHTLADTDSIQELCIDGSMLADSIQTQPSLEWDETITFRFPNLRKLKLVHLELDIIHPTIPCQMGITDLVIENVWITSGYLPYLLHETTSLERFSVVGKTSSDLDEHVRLVLEAYPIQCLHYEVQDACSGTQPIFTQDTPTLSSLRTLHLDGVRMDLEMMEILSRCCSQLEDFSVSGRMIHLASRDWAMLIRAGTFPALRDLSLPLGTNVPPFLTWTQAERASIINECRIRQIGVMGL